MNFALFNANLQSLQYYEEIKAEAVLSQADSIKLLDNAAAVISSIVYDYSPLKTKEIASLASRHKVSNVVSLQSELSTLKPGKLTRELVPLTADDRTEEFRLLKKCAPATEIALSYYLYCLYRKAFQVTAPKTGPKKPTFPDVRFVANAPGWQVVRKADPKAERKAIFVPLVNMLESVNRKRPQFSSELKQTESEIATLLAKFSERKSFSKIAEILAEALKQGVLSGKSQAAQAYAVYKICDYCGYSPFTSIETMNSVYPELKIPKPKGRQKKA